MIKQVKFFLSKDCPSKVSLQAQDCLRAKTWASCLKNDHSVNHHSRFEGGCSTDPLQEKLSDIAQIKWKCPPKVSKYQTVPGCPYWNLVDMLQKILLPLSHITGVSLFWDVPNCMFSLKVGMRF